MIGIQSLENDFVLKVFEGVSVSIPYLSKTEGKKKHNKSLHIEKPLIYNTVLLTLIT